MLPHRERTILKENLNINSTLHGQQWPRFRTSLNAFELFISFLLSGYINSGKVVSRGFGRKKAGRARGDCNLPGRERGGDLISERGEAGGGGGGVVFSGTALNQLSELASEAVAVRRAASREGPAAIPRPRLRGTRGGRRRGGPSRAPAARSWFRVSHLNIEVVRERLLGCSHFCLFCSFCLAAEFFLPRSRVLWENLSRALSACPKRLWIMHVCVCV